MSDIRYNIQNFIITVKNFHGLAFIVFIHPFRFLDDRILRDGLALICSYTVHHSICGFFLSQKSVNESSFVHKSGESSQIESVGDFIHTMVVFWNPPCTRFMVFRALKIRPQIGFFHKSGVHKSGDALYLEPEKSIKKFGHRFLVFGWLNFGDVSHAYFCIQIKSFWIGLFWSFPFLNVEISSFSQRI